MPDRGGRQTLHRLCDSVSGVSWRPTRFEDELKLVPYACCVCHVIPGTTALLPCSHFLCEQCLTGCVVQDGGSVCPMDAEPFCEDECQKIKLPDNKRRNLKAHCWNEADGCEFVGTIEAVLLHFDRQCAFHALQCPRCEQRIRRTVIAAHYVAGCSQNASCASGAQQSRQDGSSTSWETSVILEQFSTLQSQMNELVEQSRQRDASQIQEIGRVLRDSQVKVKEDVKAQLQEIVPVVRASESDLKENVKTQLRELVHVVRDSGCELKEHVSRVEAGLSSRLTEQRQSLQGSLDWLKQNCESAEREGHLSVAASGKQEEIPFLVKLDMFVNESLRALELLRQQAYKDSKTLWVSSTSDFTERCVLGNSDCRLRLQGFDVILENCDIIFKSHSGIRTVVNKYYRDMLMQISISADSVSTDFWVRVDCLKTSGNSSFPFTTITVGALRSTPKGIVSLVNSNESICIDCPSKHLSHRYTHFWVDERKLGEDGIIKDGKLTLRFGFD